MNEKKHTRISTEAYIAAFKAFRNEHYQNGKWAVYGQAFVAPFNKAVVEFLKEEHKDDKALFGNLSATLIISDDRDSFDKRIKAKHTSVKAKIRKDHRKALNAKFNVDMPKGRGSKEDTSNLTPDERAEYLSAKTTYESAINSAIPSLPSYDGTRKTRSGATSGQDLLKMLTS